MSENSPIKDALYAKIDEIGQEQIHQLLLNKKFSELFETKETKEGLTAFVEKRPPKY